MISRQWSSQVRVLVFVVLVTLGLMGNYFRYPIFLNIDFLFGSIFAMLALQVFGLGRGVVAATLITAVTYLLWNHPFAIIIMGLEVAVVGGLLRRQTVGLVLADGIYWLCIGMPLVYLFYHGIMDVPVGNTTIVMVKQAVNGIANALMARLLFTCYVLVTRSGQITYRDLVYNLLCAFALYPALFLLMVASHSDYLAADRAIQTELRQDAGVMGNHLALWVQDRTRVVTNLANLAATRTPAQMQPFLEQAHAGDDNFQRISFVDAQSVSRAFSPLVDELGQSNIGKNYADRPFITPLKQTLKPMLSELVMGRIGRPVPVVSMLAPIVVDGQYAGLISGSLSLTQILEHLGKSAAVDGNIFTLLDKNSQVILSNRKGQAVMAAIDRGHGMLKTLDQGMAQWLPQVQANTPVSERWRTSFYVIDTPVGTIAEWRLVVEQPVAPFQKVLYARYTEQLTLLLLVLLSALVASEFLSRKVSERTEELTAFTTTLPVDLGMGIQPVWPQSALAEHARLIGKFKQMAESLATQFDNNRQLARSLEERVVQRTVALAHSEEKYRHLVESSHDIIYTLNQEGIFTFVSGAWTTLLGHPVGDVIGHSFKPFVHPDDIAVCMASMEEVFAAGQDQHNVEYRVLHVDGTWHWHTSNSVPLRDEAGTVIGYEGIASDVTDRKMLEDQVRQMAFYDPLTRLPNRRLLSDRMQQAMAASKRSTCYGALMFLDLDNFKSLNDTQGHGVGDRLLIEVARRLQDCVRAVDTVARFGGDEFVVVLGDLDKDPGESTVQAHAIAEKVRDSLAQPYLLKVQTPGADACVVTHRCTASIGVVIFVNHAVQPEDALKWADAAMYQAKDAGGDVIRFYDHRHAAPG